MAKDMSIAGGIMLYNSPNRLANGNAPLGRKVYFNGVNGREYQLQEASRFFTINQILTVQEIHVNQSSSEVTFVECPNFYFNTVMFTDVNPSEELKQHRRNQRYMVNVNRDAGGYDIVDTGEPETEFTKEAHVLVATVYDYKHVQPYVDFLNNLDELPF